MIFGAIGLLLCAYSLSQFIRHFRLNNVAIALIIFGVWSLTVAAFWGVFLK